VPLPRPMDAPIRPHIPPPGDSLAPPDVVPRLRGRLGRSRYVYVRSCPSTQRLLGEHDAEGAVAVAEHQTEGRGRLGRQWDDAPGTALLVSVLLRPRLHGDRLPTLSPLAGGACAEAIREETGLDAEVKFPNDVLVAGQKIAGVLAEASGGRVVLGIGVNVNQTRPQLPGTARLPATSLRLLTGRLHARGDLLVALLHRLELRYEEWLTRPARRS
jgi:BirA family transcriptional regulator, biotin operon repressor / biotin---[acetyl-CoA-carboxylase] ligase